MSPLRAILIKPSKYGRDGFLEQFGRGYMPNAALPYIHSMIPTSLDGVMIEKISIDEYVRTDIDYADLFDTKKHGRTLVLLVGVQSHQFHRALDLAALAISHNCMAIIGGPHPMTCDTTDLQGRGVSFALSEAESVLLPILADAIAHGQLQDIYGKDQRWVKTLDPPVPTMPNREEMRSYVSPMLGVYPARGCPYTCSYCSVIKIAGRVIRSQPVATTIETLKRARAAGIRIIFFTTDNFNKYPNVVELCEEIIRAKVRLNYFVQCDTQLVKQPELIKLFARAGVFQIFFGAESLNLEALKAVHKNHNRPDTYRQLVEMCDAAGINSHLSMINGFTHDTYTGVLQQLSELKRINPSVASFYTLCPIPGTEDYNDFMAQGLIREKNLDRFDGVCPTWQHPHLSWEELDELFKRCYLEFYSQERVAKYKSVGNQMSNQFMQEYASFARHCAMSGDHPMSGGFDRKRIIHMDDHIALRWRTFDCDLVPLPKSLKLSAAEQAYNDSAKIKQVHV